MPTPRRADLVAGSVTSQFGRLPAKSKPGVRDNGIHEWVPLSGIVADQDGKLTCLALATGAKCLPASKLGQTDGNAIHDWHAEILAIRAFNRYLLDECRRLQQGKPSAVLQTSPGDAAHPFALRDNVKLHMYCSEAPCGDASMELVMAAQEDASPWRTAPPADAGAGADSSTLPGRAHFSQLGIVRRKPARRDAPPTLSKSCSDKITLKQCTSLLSSLTSLLVDPANAYLESLVLPESQFSESGCQRAFSRRVGSLADASWPGGYKFRAFAVETTREVFDLSRRSVGARADKVAPSNLAAAWTCSGVEETILGGVVRGRRPFEEKGASSMSRRQVWMLARALSDALPCSRDVRRALAGQTQRVKRQVRESALTGWVRNLGDSSFSIH
ncbi:hypothetical protein UVI_02032570 [Ustilaginoidea virens]|uniref:A to I editase domain-containing protein n=1 Tax=Ustilaginoidea virens TaxID=1159556 RepID=A0A1B5KWU9_USTVR|nr:hypothetical protein UVI_02032570 [Ustilaginoidea virens]